LLLCRNRSSERQLLGPTVVVLNAMVRGQAVRRRIVHFKLQRRFDRV
jgi:hypothetical protein